MAVLHKIWLEICCALALDAHPGHPLTFADIPVRDKATKQETMANIPFLLPHEMLEVIAQANPETIGSFVAANIQEQHLKATATEWAKLFQKSMNNIIPLDLHGDGVPFARKIKDSLAQLSWSLAADPTAPQDSVHNYSQ